MKCLKIIAIFVTASFLSQATFGEVVRENLPKNSLTNSEKILIGIGVTAGFFALGSLIYWFAKSKKVESSSAPIVLTKRENPPGDIQTLKEITTPRTERQTLLEPQNIFPKKQVYSPLEILKTEGDKISIGSNFSGQPFQFYLSGMRDVNNKNSGYLSPPKNNVVYKYEANSLENFGNALIEISEKISPAPVRSTNKEAYDIEKSALGLNEEEVGEFFRTVLMRHFCLEIIRKTVDTVQVILTIAKDIEAEPASQWDSPRFRAVSQLPDDKKTTFVAENPFAVQALLDVIRQARDAQNNAIH